MRNWPLAARSPVSQVVGTRRESCTFETDFKMFRRKLTALDYHNPNGFDCTGKEKITILKFSDPV